MHPSILIAAAICVLSPVVHMERVEIKNKDYCGYSKGCLMSPNTCDSMDNCIYLFTFRDNGSYIDFEMSARVQSPGWLAVGFSDDQKMGDDSVIECINRGTGRMQVYNSYNMPSDSSVTNDNIRLVAQDPLQNQQKGLTAIAGDYFPPANDGGQGILSCKFSRLKRVEDEPQMFDLTEKWYLLMAKGQVDGLGNKIKHDGEGSDRPLHSNKKADLRSTGPVLGNQCSYNLLIRIHGVLMVIAWIGCISSGILIARYFKFTWPGTTLAGEAIWFQLHRLLQIIAIVLILTAIVLIFVAVGGWIDNDSSLPHAICGIIAASFAVLQPFFALCRCHPGTKNRPIFNWVHWLVGSVAHMLALIAIFLAVDIGKTCLKPYVDYILVAFVIFHVIIEIILEIHACCYRQSKAGTRDLILNNYGQFMPEREREEIHGSVFQQCVLAVYGLVVFGIVMALVVIILMT